MLPGPMNASVTAQRVDLDAEWLETDGLSGYACGTVSLHPARRYHGLLVAPRPGTATRHVFLAGFDEWIGAAGDATSILLTPRHRAEAAGAEAPLLSFTRAPWPRTVLGHEDLRLQREVLMPRGRHAVLIRYENVGDQALDLQLRPRLPAREADALTFCNEVLDEAVDVLPGGIRCQPYAALPALHLYHEADAAVDFVTEPHWDKGIELRSDLRRGFDGHEDWFSPGRYELRLEPGQALWLGACIDAEALDPRACWRAASAGRSAPGSPDLGSRLAATADDFLYRHPVGDGRASRLGILAGFPWFGEWGRDTFLALPGLTLARGQLETCAEVLCGVLPFVCEGLIPNIFGTCIEDSHYGSVDAALWYARAVLLYDRAGGDPEVLRRQLYPVLQEIAAAYAAGSAPRIQALGIGSDAEGMLVAGTAELNPTWMDAKPHTGAVTPRHGCPVEIAALWHSLHAQLAELAGRCGDGAAAERYGDRAAQLGEVFLRRFWLPERGYLADVWRPEELDTSLRPNMVFAASLEFSPLNRAQRRGILEHAQRELVTPCGLRTLAPADPAYRGRYEGDALARDTAYHQGTVWPWLLGMYVEAWLRVEDTAAQRTKLRILLDGLLPELDRAGLDHISEVFDGDPPQRPGGTFAQAWNSGEILRAQDLLGAS